MVGLSQRVTCQMLIVYALKVPEHLVLCYPLVELCEDY